MDDRGRTVVGLVLATCRIGSRGHGAPHDEPAALCTLDGVPLVAHAVRALRASAVVDTVLAGVPPGQSDRVRAALDTHVPDHRVVVVEAPDHHDPDPSADRAHPEPPTAVAWACRDADVVVVHDCRRPLAPATVADAVVAAVRADVDLAVPVVAVTETVKELDGHGWIVRTVARDVLRHAQSPWAVRADLVTGWPPPAPARFAGRVAAVPGHPDAFAVRTPDDVALAAAVLRGTRG